jgi:hypothetical protein
MRFEAQVELREGRRRMQPDSGFLEACQLIVQVSQYFKICTERPSIGKQHR